MWLKERVAEMAGREKFLQYGIPDEASSYLADLSTSTYNNKG